MSESQNSNKRVNLAYRMVQVCLLLSLVWKYEFFYNSIKLYAYTPIDDAFFPSLLRSDLMLVGSFAAVVVATALCLLIRQSTVRLVAGAVTLVGLTMLCLHQGSYNDATFTTAWWTSLWSVWFATRVNQDEEGVLLYKGAFLSRCIISMILLGGAVGKWTAEYWSGDVMYDIYFADRDFWTFNWLRDHYDAEALRSIATSYSRLVIVTETVAGLTLWVLPARIASVLAISLLAAIAVFSNFLLFSVLLSLIGLAVVGLFSTARYTPSPSIRRFLT